jgi:hypothetical protein
MPEGVVIQSLLMIVLAIGGEKAYKNSTIIFPFV